MGDDFSRLNVFPEHPSRCPHPPSIIAGRQWGETVERGSIDGSGGNVAAARIELDSRPSG